MVNYASKLSKRIKDGERNPINDAMNLLSKYPNMISFAGGLPDTSLLPTEILGDLTKNAVNKYGKKILQYGQTRGFAPLCDALVPVLAKRGVHCTSEDINVATGATGAINALCLALLDAGDEVLIEEPSYLPIVKLFSAYQAKVTPITYDDEGMDPVALEERLKTGRVKFVYLMPTFQNPTGRSMSLARRKVIADLLIRYDTLLIEDDVYSDLRYEGDRLPAVHSFAPDNTLYVSSVSKVFSPAMRIGYAVLPPVIMERVMALKPSVDMQTSVYNQALVADFIADGYMDRHIEKIVASYARKRHIMLEALAKYMPTGFMWNEPEGGMFMWVRGPEGFDAEVALRKAATMGAAFIPGGSFFHSSETHRQYMRINFTTVSAEDIVRGVEIIGRACHETTP